MAESRKQKQQRQRRASKEKRDRELARAQFRKSLLSYAGKFFGGLIGVATLYTLFFQMPASFSPFSQALLSATDPFSTQFTFTNDGLVAAYQIQPKCVLNSVTTRQGFKIANTLSWQEKDLIPFVSAKDWFTVPCRFLIGGLTTKTADISLTFSYRSKLFFWRSNQAFRFVLNISDNGTAIWLQQPVQ